MGYRKFRAAEVFDGYKIREDHVLITNGAGQIVNLLPSADAGEDQIFVEGMLMPGLINAHCHLELSHMKGLIPEGTGLVDFVCRIVAERHHPTEKILEAIHAAEDEMIRNGIVAVGDICNNSLTITQKQKGRILYYNFYETSGWVPAIAAERIISATKLAGEFVKIRQAGSIVPHAPYSVSNQLWDLLQPLFFGQVVTIHNQECAAENELFMEGRGDFLRMYETMKIDHSHYQPSGTSSVRFYFPKMKQAANIILVHNSFISDDDLKFIASTKENFSQQNVFFCLCPNANYYIERVMPPVELLRQHKVDIVLGTDSLASNHSLDIMSEIRMIRRHFPDIPKEELLRWATINGAKALMLDQMLGSFEKGKRPGVIAMKGDFEEVEVVKWWA